MFAVLCVLVSVVCGVAVFGVVVLVSGVLVAAVSAVVVQVSIISCASLPIDDAP